MGTYVPRGEEDNGNVRGFARVHAELVGRAVEGQPPDAVLPWEAGVFVAVHRTLRSGRDRKAWRKRWSKRHTALEIRRFLRLRFVSDEGRRWIVV